MQTRTISQRKVRNQTHLLPYTITESAVETIFMEGDRGRARLSNNVHSVLVGDDANCADVRVMDFKCLIHFTVK